MGLESQSTRPIVTPAPATAGAPVAEPPCSIDLKSAQELPPPPASWDPPWRFPLWQRASRQWRGATGNSLYATAPKLELRDRVCTLPATENTVSCYLGHIFDSAASAGGSLRQYLAPITHELSVATARAIGFLHLPTHSSLLGLVKAGYRQADHESPVSLYRSRRGDASLVAGFALMARPDSVSALHGADITRSTVRGRGLMRASTCGGTRAMTGVFTPPVIISCRMQVAKTQCFSSDPLWPHPRPVFPRRAVAFRRRSTHGFAGALCDVSRQRTPWQVASKRRHLRGARSRGSDAQCDG